MAANSQRKGLCAGLVHLLIHSLVSAAMPVGSKVLRLEKGMLCFVFQNHVCARNKDSRRKKERKVPELKSVSHSLAPHQGEFLLGSKLSVLLCVQSLHTAFSQALNLFPILLW